MTTAAEIQHLQDNGLYSGANEHDACGVGFVAHIKGEKSHAIVTQALKILENLDHRGAVGADKLMGDGAGILIEGKPAGLALEIVDTQLRNTLGGPAPIWIEGRQVPTVDVSLRNITVLDHLLRPVIHLQGAVSGLCGDVAETNPTKCVKVDLGAGNDGLRVTCHGSTTAWDGSGV